MDDVTESSISSITRSGTTFTAKNSSGTSLFTFTQQDTDTTTGTTYSAGSCPNNTTFATNGSVYNVYNALSGSISTEAVSYTPNSSILGSGTYLSIYRCGNVVMISGVMKNISSASVGTGATILSGLPEGTWITYIGGICNSKPAFFLINASGDLCWNISDSNNWTSGSSVTIFGTYVAQN